MEALAYKEILEQEKKHWWFKARREIVEEEIKSYNLKKDCEILEIGCGTGGNIPLLKKFGNLFAIEMDEFAIKEAKKHNINIKQGVFPEKIPFKRSFDLICMFDVLEHIEDDKKTIDEKKKLLKPDGILLITVPAYNWLYGTHDKFLHHKRRYTIKSMENLSKGKLQIKRKTYFNTLLFPLVVIARLIDKLRDSNKSLGSKTPNRLLNSIFFKIFRLEKYWLKSSSFRYGSSILISFKN